MKPRNGKVGTKAPWCGWAVLAAALSVGAIRVEPRVISTIRLDAEIYAPGQVPTLDFNSTGFPKIPPQGSDRVEVLLCFSTLPGAAQTSIFPPYSLGQVAGQISIQIQLDQITCLSEEQFIQGEVMDPLTGLPIQATNEVQLRIDKTSCDPIQVGGQGCPPEVWNDPEQFARWPIPIVPPNLFDDIFEDAFPGMTLDQVLDLGDGALRELGRQTVAALLNAWSPEVNYDLTEIQVLDMFNQTFPGSDDAYQALAQFFEALNNQACPLLDPAGG